MLARAYRFHGHSSLRYVYARGQAVRGAYGVLKYAPNPRRKQWRAAIVVSRKVHKSAVIRNRIRRRLYEVLRTSIPATASPTDLVFVVHSSAVADVPSVQLRQTIQVQLVKAGIELVPHAIVNKKE